MEVYKTVKINPDRNPVSALPTREEERLIFRVTRILNSIAETEEDFTFVFGDYDLFDYIFEEPYGKLKEVFESLNR